MGQEVVCITYDQPCTREFVIEIFETVLRVVRKNWLDSTDEWSRYYCPPLEVLSGVDGIKRVLENVDFSMPDHADAYIMISHSPLTNYLMWCFVDSSWTPGDAYNPLRTEVLLKILPGSFYENRGYREKMRLERGWQACREPAWGDNTPWERMPPRTPEFARWWRNYEEACAATEDVGEKNFAYFMRIVEELKKLYPVIAYEADDTFTDYESVPAEKARWAREDAEQEARLQQEEAEKRERGEN